MAFLTFPFTIRMQSIKHQDGRPRLPASIRGRRRLVSLFLLLSSPFVQADSTLEYQVKASYLFNFIRFIEWPKDVFGADRKFRLCVVGASDRFANALSAIAGERVEGREIVIRRLEESSQAQAQHCQLVYFSEDSEAKPAAAPRGTLLVGETPGFLTRGGMINLVQFQGHIRFEISQQAAQRSGLVVSSRLLKLSL